MSRRELISGTAAVAGVALASQLGNPLEPQPTSQPRRRPSRPTPTPTSTIPPGEFQADKAKEAYFDMFKRFGYPSPKPRKELGCFDFGLGDFANVGMAGIFWLNRQDYGYLATNLSSARPDDSRAPALGHRQGAGEDGIVAAAPGMIYTFGEGEPTPELLMKIPASQRESSSRGIASRWRSTKSPI